MPDICDEENLVESLTGSKVESAGCRTKGCDAGVIGRLEWGTCTEEGVQQLGSWQNAVHDVCDKEQVTLGTASGTHGESRHCQVQAQSLPEAGAFSGAVGRVCDPLAPQQ